jgi:hypothetical protein
MADIGGKPMLKRVLEGCGLATSPAAVLLCTDSPDLAASAASWGFDAILTSPACESGSERIASVADQLLVRSCSSEPASTLIINVQGDQPFIDPAVIDAMAAKPVKTVGRYQNVPVTDIVVTQSSVVQEASTVYSRSGVLDVGRLEAGGRWIYSTDGGATSLTSTTAQLSLAEKRYELGDILILQSDAAGNPSKPTLYGRTLVVDKTAPQLTGISPAGGATQIQPGSSIVLSFSEDVLLGAGSFTLKTAAGAAVALLQADSERVKVSGKSIATAATGPMPGRTPISVPTSTPMKQ